MDEREVMAVKLAGILADLSEQEAMACLIYRWDQPNENRTVDDYLALAGDLLTLHEVYRQLAPVAEKLVEMSEDLTDGPSTQR